MLTWQNQKLNIANPQAQGQRDERDLDTFEYHLMQQIAYKRNESHLFGLYIIKQQKNTHFEL